MLPQMMPLPWILVFFLVFFTFFSLFLYFSHNSFSSPRSLGGFKSSSVYFPW